MGREVLTFEHVDFAYGEQKVIQNCSFTVNDGEFVSIVGPSGCGKTTLFRLISGLEKQSQGLIRLNGEEENNRLGLVGYMPQSDLLMPWKTIADNIAIPLIIQGKDKKMARKIAGQMLDKFQLGEYAHQYPKELSGGMRQRVAFARTVLTDSQLLILDEPFSALDAMTKSLMQEWLLEKWSEMKRTIIFITHDVEEAIFLSDRIFLFQKQQKNQLKEFVVPLQRPRMIEQMISPQVITWKQQLINQLREQYDD